MRLTIIICMLLSCFVFDSQAQYLFTLKDGKKWTIRSAIKGSPGIQGLGYLNYEYILKCDTILPNGHTYHILYKLLWNNTIELKGYLREDTTAQKVYFVSKNNLTQEHIMMDLDLAVGDTLVYLGVPIVVKSVHTLFRYGKNRKTIDFHPVDVGVTYSIRFYEGIGTNYRGVIGSHSMFNSSCLDVVDSSGITCSTVLVPDPPPTPPMVAPLRVSPNPASTNIEISTGSGSNPKLVTIYNMVGIVMDSFYVGGGLIYDVTDLSTGLYLIVVEGLDPVKFYKI